jgi:ADP-ribose pyrophosphatase YjhB (NUDIX family)
VGHVIGALVFVPKGDRILLVRWRSKGGFWSLPGGTVEQGESIEHAAAREVREETGLEVRIRRVIGVYSKPAEGSVAITLEGDIIGGVLRQQTEETREAAFFAVDALPEPVMPHLAQRVEDYRSGRSEAFLRTQ